MDGITPVGAMIKPPPQQNAIQTLSGLLGLKQQQLALQTGQQQLQTQTAEAQQAQQKNQQLTALSQFAQKAKDDPTYLNKDGSPNVAKFQQDAQAIGGVYGQAYIGQMLDNFKTTVGARQALFDLGTKEQSNAASIFSGIANDPNADRSTLINAVTNARMFHPNNKNYQHVLDNALTAFPVGISQEDIQKHAATIAGVFSGKGTAAPTTMNLGGVVQPGQTTTLGPGLGGFTPQGEPQKTVIPEGYTIGPNNQLVKIPTGGAGLPTAGGSPGTGSSVGPSPSENPFENQKGGAWTSQDTMPPPNAPGVTQKAYADAVQQAVSTVHQARAEDQQYGTNMSLADVIRRLAGSTNTGPGTDAWNHVIGAIGSPLGIQNVSTYQQLGAFLDNQASRLQTSMGLPSTNAGLAAGQAIGGNTSYQPDAIIAKDNYLQALVEGNHQYRQMMDRVEKFTGNPNPQAVQAARAAWVNNFDPRIYELELAAKRGGQDLQQVLSTLTPQEAAELRTKRKNLNDLANGKMPK